jgi:hypothetical protein
MTNKTAKKPIVTLNLRTGPASPAAKAIWAKWWARLLAEAKREVK